MIAMKCNVQEKCVSQSEKAVREDEGRFICSFVVKLTGLAEAVVRRTMKRAVVRSSICGRFFSAKEGSYKQKHSHLNTTRFTLEKCDQTVNVTAIKFSKEIFIHLVRSFS